MHGYTVNTAAAEKWLKRRSRYRKYKVFGELFLNTLFSAAGGFAVYWFSSTALDQTDGRCYAKALTFFWAMIDIIDRHEIWASAIAGASISIFFIILVRAFKNWKKPILVDSSGLFYSNPNSSQIRRQKSDAFLTRQALLSPSIKILGATGKETFARKGTVLHNPVDNCRNLHVLLWNPLSEHTRKRTKALGVDWKDYIYQICYSIKFIEHQNDKKETGDISLRFYWRRPLWKFIILDKMIWAQQYRKKKHVRETSSFAFKSLDLDAQGMFTFMCSQFMKTWNSPKDTIYEYDFQKKAIKIPLGNERFEYRRPNELIGDYTPPGAKPLKDLTFE